MINSDPKAPTDHLFGVSYSRDCAPVDWAISGLRQHDRVWRFETRRGFRADYDETRDRPYTRSELHSRPHSEPRPVWMAFDLMMINIASALPMFEEDDTTRRPNTNANVCQVKGSPDPTGLPLFAVNINSDGFRIIVGGGGAAEHASGHDRSDFYMQQPMERYRWYRWVAQIRPGTPDTSLLKVWLDGRKVVQAEDINIGYPETTSIFYKFGLYCHESVGDMTVLLANPEVGDDLRWRLANPRDLPPHDALKALG